MSTAVRADSRVEPPPEFLGKARALRHQLIAGRARYDPVMARTATDAQAAARNRTTPLKLAQLERITARWRAIGTEEGCLSQSIVLDRRSLTVSDIRLVASSVHRDPDPRLPNQAENDRQVFCALENRLVITKRAPLWLPSHNQGQQSICNVREDGLVE